MNTIPSRETTPKKEKKPPRKRKAEAGAGAGADGEALPKPKRQRAPKPKSAGKDADLGIRDVSPVPLSFLSRNTSSSAVMPNDAEFNDDDDDDLSNLTPPPASESGMHVGNGSGDDDDDDDDARSTEAGADDAGSGAKGKAAARSNVGLMDDDDDDALMGLGGNEDDLFGMELQAPDPQTMSAIMASLSPDQMSRYEHFRRSKLPKNHVNKIVQNVLGQKPPASASFVVQSAGKLFIGDMVERALTVQAEMGDVGALQPKHLREAYQTIVITFDVCNHDIIVLVRPHDLLSVLCALNACQ
ncbi:hypothetical protein SeMB42_g00673 [Synchytrium endobioticum]|uniref:TAFII28-like protein domain-containing protein n=1 Tax=Synchytrium endobioticum TaxID=286115 RepID=A0A507DI82_9FUNG|nr:hypothetical protein SeLEV6574_g00829 [Synchytrium endobioticum]TPX53582.1 hypothetical protein SeMB42_g00673 [Synchytrium endobioticum]